jgi:hypothetical protein
MALRDYLKRPNFEPKPTEPPPRMPKPPWQAHGRQLHLPARLLVGAAAVPPVSYALVTVSGGVAEQVGVAITIAPFAFMAGTRKPSRFRAVGLGLIWLYSVAAVLAGLALFIVGALLFAPTIVLLNMAMRATADSPRLLENHYSASVLVASGLILLAAVLAATVATIV